MLIQAENVSTILRTEQVLERMLPVFHKLGTRKHQGTDDDIFWSLFPLSTNYVAPHLPLNLFDFINDIKFLSRLPYFTIRDGIIPAMSFFSTHVNPPGENQFYLVSEDVFICAPIKWRKQMFLYKETPGPFRPVSLVRKPKTVYLYFNTSPSLSPLGMNKKVVRKFITKITQGLPAQLILDGHYKDGPDFLPSFKDVEIMSVRNFSMKPELGGDIFMDLNEKNFYYHDSFLTFEARRKGALVRSWAGENSEHFDKECIHRFPVSPFHSISVYKPSAALIKAAHTGDKNA